MSPAVENFRESLQGILNENSVTGIRYNIPPRNIPIILNAVIEKFDGTVQLIISFTEYHYELVMRFIEDLQSIANIQKIEVAKELLGLPTR